MSREMGQKIAKRENYTKKCFLLTNVIIFYLRFLPLLIPGAGHVVYSRHGSPEEEGEDHSDIQCVDLINKSIKEGINI